VGNKVTPLDSTDRRSRHLRWENFASRIHEGPPSLEPIRGTPRIVLFIEPGGSRIGVRFYTKSADSPANPLAEVAIRSAGMGTSQMLEVSTANKMLFRDFYAFCCTVADRVQLDHQSVTKAITETLKSWSALIQQKSLLSLEKQVGLLGELLFLGRLAEKLGWATAVNSWQGPLSQEHDFTLDKIDIEVKTTLLERRIHQIDSLTQLMPKLNRSLVLVSIQMTPGTGKDSLSISQMVARILSTATAIAPESVDTIRDHLARLGWADNDAPHYTTHYHLRGEFAAIPVDNSCPAIVPTTLATLGPHLSSRIERLSYAIDVDGLGMLDGTKGFNKLIFSR
jgi:hypothetical protein